MPESRIHHDIALPGSPMDVYGQLLDAERFAAFSGAPAQIDGSEGGPFSLFGGQILGRNVELVAGQRVVQSWRVAGWDPGVYSLTRFELEASGSGTRLRFEHTGYPPETHDELDAGWHAMYWVPMRTQLEAG